MCLSLDMNKPFDYQVMCLSLTNPLYYLEMWSKWCDGMISETDLVLHCLLMLVRRLRRQRVFWFREMIKPLVRTKHECQSKNKIDNCPKICHVFFFVLFFFASSPNPKGYLTRNLVGVTCRFKIANFFPIANPRWQPWRPACKSIFRFFSWSERPIDMKLGRNHQGGL